MTKKRCLVSVYDKTGLEDLAKTLLESGYEIFSTGGTLKFLLSAGLKAAPVEEITGFPEILDGRVKTLHPKIYGGLLYIRGNEKHEKDMRANSLQPVDMIVCNLYPFSETSAKYKLQEYPDPEVIENIDIGGVSILRAAAKNYREVIVVCSPGDYGDLAAALKTAKGPDLKTRYRLAIKAFGYTASYDAAIAGYLSGKEKLSDNMLPEKIELCLKKQSDLRYGENPHQKAAFYLPEQNTGVLKVIQGKELSYNNYLDLEAAYRSVRCFDRLACSIIKHQTPCGIAVGNKPVEAFLSAYSCDRISAFGGIIGFNTPADEDTAEEIIKSFFECVTAPEFTPGALEIFGKKQNLRIVKHPGTAFEKEPGIELRQAFDGWTAQFQDDEIYLADPVCVTKKKPSAEEKNALDFAWRACKSVKSNAVVFSNGKMTLGIGGGQTSRIDSMLIAREKAGNNGHSLEGAALASDAFFPFPDSIEEAAKLKISAIIQPGGSIKDKEVIEAADRCGIKMLFTGIRHFRH